MTMNYSTSTEPYPNKHKSREERAEKKRETQKSSVRFEPLSNNTVNTVQYGNIDRQASRPIHGRVDHRRSHDVTIPFAVRVLQSRAYAEIYFWEGAANFIV